jgi:putative acyl-CoA dehydrogenase
MIHERPRTHLETHDVVNQPPPFEGVNLFASDKALQDAVARAGGGMHADRLSRFGADCGSSETAVWAMQANRNPPQWRAFDRFGDRIDEVDFHPAYHRLMNLGIGAGVSSVAWSGVSAGHVLHAGLEFLMAQAEPGVCCPMTMTYAAIAALRHEPGIFAAWAPKIQAGIYDPSSRPMGGKSGVTIGMAMTEKQGGSDVRANTTRAARIGGGFALTGHKWFCSAPMSDAFLTLAYTEKGLSCFLAPRWKPDGERNAIQLMRLKDKLGDRANASGEIEYHGAFAVLVGEEGRGVRTIIDMVHHTRLDCTLAPAAYMRQALANALWHAEHRSVFQKKLIDQPLMRGVLADMALESEAATALVFRIARSFDESAESEAAAAFSRIATPLGKYWINKRVVNFVYEAMEVHGGAGYIEESVMPRLYRQSPLNSIWEGSGNVICLDVLRALDHGRNSATAGPADVFVAELESVQGNNAMLDRAIADVKKRLAVPTEEAGARRLAEAMALALQAAALSRTAPDFVFDAFCTLRLGDRCGSSYGAFDAKIDVDAIIRRAIPETCPSREANSCLPGPPPHRNA